MDVADYLRASYQLMEICGTRTQRQIEKALAEFAALSPEEQEATMMEEEGD